ncbi:hypothetical protein C8C93_0896 [Acidovorax sp. 93]|uniref:hypothetical protein n=1 Tax=Acidovorax sp. 93 TaxID=2135632 RepID=UPI000F20C488|nr:hypothetical protein [Acidovorax sp. 93]RKR25684.1 hypothetical protein C8C93_0896 [Acidovorax sp. 93]
MRSVKLSTAAIFGAEAARSTSFNDLFSKEGQQTFHECYWSETPDGLELPVALRPFSDDDESLFADVATYFPTFVPITAYMHVFSRLSMPQSKQRFKDIQPSLNTHEVKSAIGLAIGELLTSSARSSKFSTEHVSYSASRRTLSFAVYRSAALYSTVPSSQVVERWLRIREIVGMESQMDLAASIAWVAALQRRTTAHDIEDNIHATLAEVIAGRSPLNSFGYALASISSDMRRHIDAIRGPFDNRVEAFSQLIKTVKSEFPSGEIGAICIGYFCNEILPGSLSHFRLLTPLAFSHPTVLLWYSMFASLSERFDWQQAFSGFGLKMARDLLKPFSPNRRPTCDIAYEELEVLSRLPLKADIVKPEHPRVCLVSVFPGVEGYFRFGSEEETMTPTDTPQKPPEDQLRREALLRDLLREALDLVAEPMPPPQPSIQKRTKRSRDN